MRQPTTGSFEPFVGCLLLALAILTACGGEPRAERAPAPSEGAVHILASGLSADRVTHVVVTLESVSPGIAPTSRTVHRNAGAWEAMFGGLNLGAEYEITAEAMDEEGALLFRTDPSRKPRVTLDSEAPIQSVVVVLQQVRSGEGSDWHAPVFEAVAVSRQPSGSIDVATIEVQGSDPDGAATEPITLTGAEPDGAWSASATLDGNPGRARLEWDGQGSTESQRLVLTLSDGDGNATMLEISIAAVAPSGAIELGLQVNHAPRLSNITVAAHDDGALDLAAVATDDHDATLTYEWTSTCGGSLETVDAAATVWNPGGAEPTSPCTFAVTVADTYGLETTGTLVVHLDDPSTEYTPNLVWDMQSHVEASEGTRLEFAAVAQGLPAADHSTITWAWSVGGIPFTKIAFPGSAVSAHFAHGYAGSRLSLLVPDGGVVCIEDERVIPGETAPTTGTFIDVELTATANGRSDTEAFSIHVPDARRAALCTND